MSFIFISYSHKDSDYAHSLAAVLEQKGFSVWIDDRIDYGTQWPRVIQEHLDACIAFIVIMTPRAYQSDWVQNELSRAKRKRKPIFPLLLEGDEPWLSVEATQYVDVRGSRLPPPDFFKRLQKVLSVSVSAPPQIKKKRPTTITKPKTKRVTAAPSPPRQRIIRPTKDFELELILIPAGEFLMGSDPNVDKDARDIEQPQHTLYLPDYYMAKTPITNAQYAAFVQTTGRRPLGYWENGKIPRGWEDHPVTHVSWESIVGFCNWLAGETGQSFRLPTEAEWEKAARGTDGRIYPWGNQWDKKRCNTEEGGVGHTTPVGAYPGGASPYGVLDMAGNAWEWCATKWGKSYPYDVEKDEWTAKYLQEGVRVMRGGSWYNNRLFARSAKRLKERIASWHFIRGIRVVSPI